MLAEVTTYTTSRNQPVDSQVELRLSTSYLLNTDFIIEMEDESTLALVITKVVYKFNVYDDRIPEFTFQSGDTIASLVTLSDAIPASTKLDLTVYDDIQTFDKIPYATTTTWFFNLEDIVWGEDDNTGNYARIWVKTGGHSLTPYIVDHTIEQLVDLADNGPTTSSTSTSSTSTSSTSSTSTSSTSTSSTSSTSTSSTSSTSTYTTSTSTSSTSTTTLTTIA